VLPIARRFHELGFRILATEGTERYLRGRGVPAERVLKVHEGRPNAIDLIVSGEVQLLINTPLGSSRKVDDYAIRAPRWCIGCRTRRPWSRRVPRVMRSLRLRSRTGSVRSLQEWHEKSERRKGADGRADSGSKRVAKPAKGAKVAKAAPPPRRAKNQIPCKLLENEPLSRYNTWRIGGPAR